MLFNSVEYLIFLPLVFILYWIVAKFNNLKIQNGLVLIASYIFYGLWDWRFLFLILASTFQPITNFSHGLDVEIRPKLTPGASTPSTAQYRSLAA